jgi:hypothetical protein
VKQLARQWDREHSWAAAINRQKQKRAPCGAADAAMQAGSPGQACVACALVPRGKVLTLSRTMSRPRMSCPMLCPKPHSAPSMVARTLLRPIVSGVSACMHKSLSGLDSGVLAAIWLGACTQHRMVWHRACAPRGGLARTACAGTPLQGLPRRCGLPLGGLQSAAGRQVSCLGGRSMTTPTATGSMSRISTCSCILDVNACLPW